MGSSLGSALGFNRADASQYEGDLTNQQKRLEQRSMGPGIATQAYKSMAGKGLGNVLAGIAQTKGLRPSAQATMADIAGSRIQGETAQNAGIMGLQEQQMNEDLLANMLLNRNKLDQMAAEGQANRLSNTFWKAAGAAGSGMSGAGAMG